MLFNSFEFLVFFIVTYLIYLYSNHRRQNWILIIASCLFYSAWNWKFLLLIFISTGTDFWASQFIARTADPQKRRAWLCLSLVVNLGILGIFKYYNFFIGNLQDCLHALNLLPSSAHWTLNIILPIGISFYTFEAISYVVDVYRRQIKPADHFWDYALFILYFPHLIAGPIMRAKNFLPQITAPRQIDLDKFYEGCSLFFWGLFEKIFIADNLAKFVDPVFSAPPPYDGVKVLMTLYAFAFQIYCDFDGYSNMARGLGKCMGFEITINFKQPYFSTNPREFWQRWHITLSSWLRDYLYIPLGGNRYGTNKTCINLFLTMLLGGLWHGAAWTFVLWGAYQGALLVGYRLLEPYISTPSEVISGYAGKIWKGIKVLFFFQLISLGWLLFRSNSLSQAMAMLKAIVNVPGWHNLDNPSELVLPAICVFIALFVGIFQYLTDDQAVILKWPWWLRTTFYITCYMLIIFIGAEGGKTFIYFQF
jgi:alginate O-acetyltransferase complex protein AlgI